MALAQPSRHRQSSSLQPSRTPQPSPDTTLLVFMIKRRCQDLVLDGNWTDKQNNQGTKKIIQKHRWTQIFTWKIQTGKNHGLGLEEASLCQNWQKSVQGKSNTWLRQLPSYTSHAHSSFTNLMLEPSSNKKEKLSFTQTLSISQEKTNGTIFKPIVKMLANGLLLTLLLVALHLHNKEHSYL